MIGLIYKDLILIKKSLLQIGLVTIAFLLPLLLPFSKVFAEQGDEAVRMLLPFITFVCFIASFLIMSMFEQGNFDKDERKVWISYVCALPGGCYKHIGAKYIISLVMHMVYFAICFLVDTVFCKVNDIDGNHLMIYGILVLAGITFKAIEIPFFIRFGIKNGNNIKTMVMMLLIMGVIVFLLFGDSEFFLKFMDMGNLLKWLTEKILAFGKANKYRMALKYSAIVLGAYLVSFLISCRLFRTVADEA